LNKLFLAALLAAAPPLAAWAADPADPAVAVPRVEYRSVFEGVPAGVEEQTIDWKKANAEVGQFPRGHIDLLKWEEAQGGKAAAPAAPPASAPASAQPPRGHQH
jgi:hypothetical protein